MDHKQENMTSTSRKKNQSTETDSENMNIEVVIIIQYDLYVQDGRGKQNGKEKN